MAISNAGGGGRVKAQEAASALVSALEATWASIRSHHDDVPAVVIVLASGTSGRAAKLGHYAASRWDVAGSVTAEVLVAGEGLGYGAAEVLGTLLHEAAHGMAHERKITDTSRGGRYHNRRYAAVAGEVGLVAMQGTQFGWALTALAEGTAQRYVDALAGVEAALHLSRRAEVPVARAASGSSLVACTCPCGRRLRASRMVLDEAEIRCGRCGQCFTG